MRTDWALVRRLASELHERLSGARVQDAGTLTDGRPAVLFWSRGAQIALALDLFGSPPVVTLENAELAAEEAPGFPRSLARVLRGFSMAEAQAREHDRLLMLKFRTRSRFGVDDEVDLYIELVPRFGNAALVKNRIVVDACKKFGAAQSARIALPGRPYEPPPLPPLRLPRVVEESGAPADALAALEGDELLREPLYVYRRDGALLQAHLLPLKQFGDATLTREPSLLDIFVEDRAQRLQGARATGTRPRRLALARRVEARLHRVEAAVSALASRESEMERREALRREGEAIYATLHELEPAARAEAKERAVKCFARYRKLVAALPHLDERRRALSLEREALETLLWETQRTPDADLGDIAQAVDALDPRARRLAPRPKRARRAPLEVRTQRGSRILIGRSPVENAELTFRVARPTDLWFHARGVPGAHVILARDDRETPPEEDVALAASLAAAHSKARESAKVAVDYTLRKHVRKRPDAPPGLVFYTDAKTLVVAPKRD